MNAGVEVAIPPVLRKTGLIRNEAFLREYQVCQDFPVSQYRWMGNVEWQVVKPETKQCKI